MRKHDAAGAVQVERPGTPLGAPRPRSADLVVATRLGGSASTGRLFLGSQRLFGLTVCLLETEASQGMKEAHELVGVRRGRGVWSVESIPTGIPMPVSRMIPARR
jgi:hypothetical protein